MTLFQPIHPIIIDLYLNILHLNDISILADGYVLADSDIPSELQTEIQNSASLYLSTEAKTIAALESKRAVDQQLSWFHERRGKA